MGYTLDALCDCGYKRTGLMIGYGMRTWGAILPFLCKPCKEVFSGNVNKKPVPCPSCSKPCKTHIREKGWQHYLRKAKYTCPQCGEKALRFGHFDALSAISGGRWD